MSEEKISITEDACWIELTDADRSVSLVTFVASASLATVSVVSAGSVGVAWVGIGIADISVARNFVTEVTGGAFDGVVTEVESVIASTGVSITLVGTSRVGLAWVKGARVNKALFAITVETIVAIARVHSSAVNGQVDRAGGVGITASGSGGTVVWNAERSITVEVKESI